MKHTDETRRKLSEMHRGSRNPFFGRKHTPEAKARMANWSRRFNLETRQYEINPRTVKDFTDCQAAYLAALIDGEGSISWRREHPAVAVYNNSQDLMEWLRQSIGVSFRLSDRRGRDPGYTWQVASAQNVHYVLCRCRPFLIIKQVWAAQAVTKLSMKYGAELESVVG